HEREKEYISSYVEDLESDLVRVDDVKPKIMNMVSTYDTLLDLIKTPRSNISHIYYLVVNSNHNWQFARNDRTVQQIKNQGGFSVITNKEFVNQIILYDEVTDALNTFGRTSDFRDADKIADVTDKIFDANILRAIEEKGPLEELVKNPSLLSTDKILLNQYNYLIQQRSHLLKWEMGTLDEIHDLADSTIRFLTNKYSFVKEVELNDNNYLQISLEETLLQQGKIAFINQYKLFKKESKAATWKGTYGILNLMAYDLLSKKNNAQAVIVFQLRVQEFPDDWDAFDSMGDGYAASGDTANAIANYRKAFEMNASDTISKVKMMELKKGK
ncbi:MAG TPA: hypothetical protein VGI61_01345, partial [Parafilimonas sp.]